MGPIYVPWRGKALIVRNALETELADTMRMTCNPSQRRLLGEVFRNPKVKQTDLSIPLGLTQPSVSRMVSALCSAGILRLGKAELDGGKGKPSPTLEIHADFSCAVGLSIAADSWSLCLVDLAGVVHELRPDMPYSGKPSEILPALRDHIMAMIDRAGFALERVAGLSIAISGFRVYGHARFNTPASLEDFGLVDLEALFSEATGLPCRAENDGKAATLAEAMIGHGRTYRDFAYLYFATGVGGGVVIDGRLFRGRNGNAGEFGGAQPLLGTRQPASLERLRQILLRQGNSYPDVQSLVRDLDMNARGISEWMEEARSALRQIITAASAILDPEAIIFGGLLPGSLAQRLIDEIGFLQEDRRGVRPHRPDIVAGSRLVDPACVGAALLPLAETYFDYL